MFNNPINLVFDKLTSALDEPKWLQQKRQQALKNFQSFGLPTRKSELWKYTDVKRLERLQDVTDLAGSGSLPLKNEEMFVFTIKSDLPENTNMQSITQLQEGN